MTTNLTLFSVVDDDESVRESLPDLLRELGYEATAFASGQEFLNSDALHQTKCLILDVAMPGMTGPELQRELKSLRHVFPVIFITAHANGTTRSHLLDEGAIECLSKPFSESDLIDALNVALN
jgi:FixJ family two-component response regulator